MNAVRLLAGTYHGSGLCVHGRVTCDAQAGMCLEDARQACSTACRGKRAADRAQAAPTAEVVGAAVTGFRTVQQAEGVLVSALESWGEAACERA